MFNIIVSQDDDNVDDIIEINETDEVIIEQYTAGSELVLTDTGEDYVGFYHVHPDKGFMVGPLHVNTPHAYLTPIVNVNVEIEDLSGGEGEP